MKIFLKLTLIFFTAFLFFFQTEKVFAEAIRSFESSIVAHQDGILDITETVQYDFGDSLKHGIYRDILKVSKVGDLYRVIDIQFKQVLRNGMVENYQDNSNTNKSSLKIGKADKTISGVHTYTIKYSVKNAVGSNYEDHDEIFWNVTGNKWKIPIEKAAVWIASSPVAPGPKMACYTGSFGSKEQNCTFATDQPNTPVVTTKALRPGEGLSVVWEFPKGTFPKSVLSKNPPSGFEDSSKKQETSPLISLIITIGLVGGVLLFNLILPLILLIWYLTRKRKNRFGPITVNFEIPKDEKGGRIPPAEAGTIDTAKLERDDVLATIFDLAIRKYIKIEQIKKKGTILGLGKGDDYLIKNLKDYQDVEHFEKILLDRLFKDGDSIKLSSLKNDFYKTFEKMNGAVFQSLIKRKYYSKNPKNQRNTFIVLGVFSLIVLALPLAVVLFFFAKMLNGRTALGDEIDWKIDGLKLFLKSVDRNYKWQAEQLYIVEKMIPYAIALGYIDEYMEQLKIIKPDYNPSWYSGNMVFYAVSSSIFFSMNSGFVTSAPSSSSGFSSGGFSGGGSGGGGGGSW